MFPSRRFLVSGLLVFSLLIAGAFAIPTDSSSAAISSGTTERVSVSSSGEQGNGYSSSPSISADAQHVAFESWSDNLASGGTNGVMYIFVRDLQTNTTERLPISSTGEQGYVGSYDPSISADGRYVTFESATTDNVSSEIFIHDRLTGSTDRVSVSSTGEVADSYSGFPSISADGRYVAFGSHATNLVDGDTNRADDIFVRDLQTGTTERVSVSSTGRQGNDWSGFPSISADGYYVAFISNATNLVSGDTNATGDIFVHDRHTGTTERASVSSSGVEGNKGSSYPSISADGRFVSFDSYASNLISGDTNNDDDIFVHDRHASTTERASVSSSGVEGNLWSADPFISADGRYVAFISGATNFVSVDTNGTSEVFVHDRQTGITELISQSSSGEQGNEGSQLPSISASGRFVAFVSDATNLVTGDTNNYPDIFIRDRCPDGSCESTPPDNTFSITGQVLDAYNTPIPGVVISTSSDISSQTGPDGWYTFPQLSAGTYTLIPSFPGFIFTPASRTIEGTNMDISGQDFMGIQYTGNHAPLGGLDLQGYCLAKGFLGVTLRKPVIGLNAAFNNWRCTTEVGDLHPFSMKQACKWQYSINQVQTHPTDPDNAYTWVCYSVKHE